MQPAARLVEVVRRDGGKLHGGGGAVAQAVEEEATLYQVEVGDPEEEDLCARTGLNEGGTDGPRGRRRQLGGRLRGGGSGPAVGEVCKRRAAVLPSTPS